LRASTVIAILLLIGYAQAVTLTVCPSGCSYADIQAAMDAANPGDTIEVHGGEYNVAVMNKDVTLKGISSGGAKPTIEVMYLCGHQESSASRFTFFVLLFGSPLSKQSKATENLSKPIVASTLAAPKESYASIPTAISSSYEQNRNLSHYESFSHTQPVIYPPGYKREYAAVYKSGRFHINVPKTNYIAIVDQTGGAAFSDFTIEFDAAQEEGPSDGDYGVVLRRIDENNYYRFRLSGDGYYEFDKLQNGNRVALVPLTKSKDILSEKATNHIKVDCYGNRFTFNVNGISLGSFNDSSFYYGGIGLEVGTHSIGGVHASFDNLKVWE
jgi:hypothetical protein